MARITRLPPNPYPKGGKYFIAKKGPKQWRLMYHFWGDVPFTIGVYSTHAMAIAFMDCVASTDIHIPWEREREYGC